MGEVGVGEKAEGVEGDHEQGRERERHERSRASRPAPGETEQSEDDPQIWPWEPTRELIQAQRQLGVSLAAGQG